ncbi:hypothetical protein K1719_007973 [Acacia pycnantha]|nr:hypothetical protein K1719_007973 [Acacia pycnantha]
MGCGASALRTEDDHNNLPYKVVRPINSDTPKAATPPPAVFPFRNKAAAAADPEEVGLKELKNHAHGPPSINVAPPHSEADAIDDNRDDAITGAASPSFREYVNSRSFSDIDLSHDDPDMVETTDNMGNENPVVGENQPSRKEITSPKREGEKKERKGRKLRDVINKGRAVGGRKMGMVRRRSDNRAGRLT